MMGGRKQRYRNSKRMSINRLVQQLCREFDVGFVDPSDVHITRYQKTLFVILQY